jgi:hypothetical protein
MRLIDDRPQEKPHWLVWWGSTDILNLIWKKGGSLWRGIGIFWKRGRTRERGVEDGFDDGVPFDADFGATSEGFDVRGRVFARDVDGFERIIVFLDLGERLEDEE